MMHSLNTLQLEITSWVPTPHSLAQRTLAMELRTFCPTLRHICFWLGDNQYWWTLVETDGNDPNEVDGDWEHEHARTIPANDDMWKECC